MSEVTTTDNGHDGELETELETEDAPRTSLVHLVILWTVFAILYGYPLFEGISNLISLPSFYDAEKIGGAVPWYLLIIGVLAPVILYLGAVLLGRGRELFPRALMLAVGLAATNALFLSVVQWAAAVQPTLK